jgi:hypothetical protein
LFSGGTGDGVHVLSEFRPHSFMGH